MHEIAQAVLTPVGLLWLSVIANPTEVDVHHFRVMRYNVRRWHLLKFYPTRHREMFRHSGSARA